MVVRDLREALELLESYISALENEDGEPGKLGSVAFEMTRQGAVDIAWTIQDLLGSLRAT